MPRGQPDERSPGRALVRIENGIGSRFESTARQNDSRPGFRIVVAPAFPLDARVQRVSVNGVSAKFQPVVIGDVQRIEVSTEVRVERTILRRVSQRRARVAHAGGEPTERLRSFRHADPQDGGLCIKVTKASSLWEL